MVSGVLYALLAGLMWGLIFVGPLIVPEYPAVLQSMGRYLALGLIALPLAWLGRARLRQLSRQDWFAALALTMMGNLIYYFCLASAIQRTGAPVSTMIIGTLPVVIPVFANLLYSHRDGKAGVVKNGARTGMHRRGTGVCEYCRTAPRADGFQPLALRVWHHAGVCFRGVLGVVCPAQRSLAAGKPG